MEDGGAFSISQGHRREGWLRTVAVDTSLQQHQTVLQLSIVFYILELELLQLSNDLNLQRLKENAENLKTILQATLNILCPQITCGTMSPT